MMKKTFAKIAALAVMAASSSVFALGPVGPGTYTNSVPFTTLSISGTLEIPSYDAATYGPLAAIILTLKADVDGSVKYESLDNAPSTVFITVAGTATLAKPGGGVIVTSLPIFNDTKPVDAFDGAVDFLGASGNTFASLSATDTQSGGINPVDFNLFINPPSSILLPYNFTSSSGVTGPGNIISQISTQGAVFASVTYVAVPEPTALGLLAPVGALLARRRRA